MSSRWHWNPCKRDSWHGDGGDVVTQGVFFQGEEATFGTQIIAGSHWLIQPQDYRSHDMHESTQLSHG